MNTNNKEDVEKAVVSGSPSDAAVTGSSEREARPSADKMPSMQDIISVKRGRASQFGNLSFGKKKVSSTALLVLPPKLGNLQLGAHEGLQLGAHEASLELLHRYNILSIRSKLLLHLRSDVALMDKDISEKVFQELSRYSSALRDYCSFRSEGRYLFPSEEGLEELFKEMATLETTKSAHARQGSGEEAAKLEEEIKLIDARIGNAFLKTVRSTTSGMSFDKNTEALEALLARLVMALGGGLALVGPMLIMVLHPTKLTALVTTSCFVVAVAIALAVFMRDSQPKDVLACTAAYAAVLVVFVGTGGGT